MCGYSPPGAGFFLDPGVILKKEMDSTHLPGFGQGNTFSSLQSRPMCYPHLVEAWHVGVIREKLMNIATFIDQRFERRDIAYLEDNSLFRTVGYNEDVLMGNVLFCAGN